MKVTHRRAITASIALLLSGAGVSAFSMAPAAADDFNGTVQAAFGLNVRSCVSCTDGVPSTSLPVLLTLPNGTRVHINCFYFGQTISGNWGNTNIWDVVQSWQLPD